MLLMAKLKQTPIFLPVQEIKKKLPETVGVLEAEPPKILKAGAPGMIPFALLSRKGNRNKLDKIELPEESSVVIKTR